MNLIIIHPEELNNNRATLNDYRARHIRKILKPQIGDSLRVGILNGKIGRGVIETISKSAVTLLIEASQVAPPKSGLELILALPRPIMLKRVLAQATTLGVNHIHLVNAKRVEKSFFAAAPIRDSSFLPYLIKGLEQAVDTFTPQVTVHPRFRPFIEDYLAGRKYSRCLLAHPDGAVSLANLPPLPTQEKIALAIGPEGGWVDFEVDKFIQAGFQSFTLGQRILRVDTAVPAIIGQLNLKLEIGD